MSAEDDAAAWQVSLLGHEFSPGQCRALSMYCTARTPHEELTAFERLVCAEMTPVDLGRFADFVAARQKNTAGLSFEGAKRSCLWEMYIRSRQTRLSG